MKKLLLISFCWPVISFGQQTYVPDDNFEAYLESNGMGNGIANDNYVTTDSINTAWWLYIANLNISNLTGIEDFTALTYLNCSNNQLTSLDITQNTALNDLYCHNNMITSIDLSSQTYFINLYLFGNNLSSLDLSHFACDSIYEPDIRTNPNLYCIKVDDVSCWSSTHSWGIDTSSQYFSLNCSTSTIENLRRTNKTLLKVTSILGREKKASKNELFFYIYDNGYVEKKIIIEK